MRVKRVLALALLACLLTGAAVAQSRSELVLEAVQANSFAIFDPADRLSVRVFAATLEQVLSVTETDIAEFCETTGDDPALLREAYMRALGNCVWAHILQSQDAQGEYGNVCRVLLLFLNPASEPNGEMQIATIRARLTDEDMTRMAEIAGLPESFVAWLMSE